MNINAGKLLKRIKESKNLKEKAKLIMLNKEIQICKEKIYTFNSNDFCQTGFNCNEKTIKSAIYGYYFNVKKIDCKCPNENSFKCGKYCTENSNACDYSRQKEIKNNKTLLAKIKNCGNDNVSILRSNFRFFESF